MLFLLVTGLTLVFGIMDMINLAYGSLYMVGAYLIATIELASGSFWVGLAGGMVATALLGMLMELTVLRRLYQRDHLSQVLGTFAILLMGNEAVRMVWGSQPIALNPPDALSGPVELLPGFSYPIYRLFIIAVGLATALLLYVLVMRTRLGMQVRAGASNLEMALAMGVNVRRLVTLVFALGASWVRFEVVCASIGSWLTSLWWVNQSGDALCYVSPSAARSPPLPPQNASPD